MACEMCGNKQGPFYEGKIEGVEMTLCSNCKGVAVEIKRKADPVKEKKRTQADESKEVSFKETAHRELIQAINSNYPQRIQRARMKRGLKQEQLAKELAEKTSVLAAMESGKHEPSIDLARKLERNLGIQLVEQQEVRAVKSNKSSVGGLTIADMLRK